MMMNVRVASSKQKELDEQLSLGEFQDDNYQFTASSCDEDSHEGHEDHHAHDSVIPKDFKEMINQPKYMKNIKKLSRSLTRQFSSTIGMGNDSIIKSQLASGFETINRTF
jgi:mRNA-degrading endonuclease RelE of RelBE toxin-antitoxin system